MKMKGKTALFLAFVSLLFGCPPGGESGTVTLGDVSVTPVRGYNTTATFELKAAVQTNVEATLTIVVSDETGAEAAKSGAMSVKAGNSTQTFSTKIEKFGNMKATFTLAAAGVETQTKSVDFEVLEGGVPSAEFGWPATGVYAGAPILISMADVKADTAGTGEGTFKFSQAAFTMTKKDGSPVGINFPKLEDSNLNTDFQINLPQDLGDYIITLSVTNTNNQTREKKVEFTIAEKVLVNGITADPSSFSGLVVNDTVKVTLTFTGEGEQTPSDINVNWDEGSNYSVELVEQTATTAFYNLTVLSTSLSSATATAADGSKISVPISFSGIKTWKAPETKTVNEKELTLAFCENFNKIDDDFYANWRANGWNSDSDKLKRFYWREEALEMTEFEGRQVFTMFTREWGSRDTDGDSFPGQDQSNGKNDAGEEWIAGGIHLQKGIVFGYIEARVRTDRNSDQHWDAFWSYDSDTESPLEYEFDVMEAITQTNLDVTTHFWAKPAKTPGYTKWDQPTKKHNEVNLNNDWYTLGLYWTPEEVIYYGYHGDEPRKTAGIKSDYTLTNGYSGSRDPQLEIPFITRWKQGFKFTTELGYNYGGGRPEAGVEDKYYIDYFALYTIPVSQAVLADGIQNGTAAFDRTKTGNNASAWADIASEGKPIYVTVTPDNGYTVSGVTARWTGGSKELEKVNGEENRWMLTVTANMPQYFDFKTQRYGEKVTITPTIIENVNAPALESAAMNCDVPFGIEGETIEVTYTPTPSDAVITNVSVNNGYSYDRETHLLTLKAVDSKTTETVTFTFTTKDNATKTAELEVTVYPDTYVQRNDVFYEPVKTVDDFSSDTAQNVKITTSTDATENLTAWNRDANEAVITVNSLPAEASADKLTISEIGTDSTDKTDWLMEMTLTYSQDGNNFRGMIFFAPDSSNLDRPWFLMRNSFNGKVGQGMAFRVGPNSEDASSKYTFEGGQELNLGFLFNGATQGETAYFFFNGETKPIPIDHASISTTKAPAITDNSITLRFGKDATDNGTITLKKIVFYKPVEDAAQ